MGGKGVVCWTSIRLSRKAMKPPALCLLSAPLSLSVLQPLECTEHLLELRDFLILSDWPLSLLLPLPR